MSVSKITKRPKNTCAKCKCGEIAKYKTEIKINQFRGDDEVFWSCEKHKNDCGFLMSNEVIK